MNSRTAKILENARSTAVRDSFDFENKNEKNSVTQNLELIGMETVNKNEVFSFEVTEDVPTTIVSDFVSLNNVTIIYDESLNNMSCDNKEKTDLEHSISMISEENVIRCELNVESNTSITLREQEVKQGENAVLLRETTPDEVRHNDSENEVMEEQEEIKPKTKRKRIAQPDTWDKNVNKHLRMSGRGYTGYRRSEGKIKHDIVRPERKIKPTCVSKFCALASTRFCANISEPERNEIFKTFWEMSWEQKRMFFAHMITYSAKKRSYVEGSSKRSGTYKYFLMVQGQKMQVCKSMFLNTLAVGEKMILNWVNSANNHGILQGSDIRRQTSTLKRKASQDKQRVNNMKNFLESLPKLESHYCRKSTGKFYFEQNFKCKSEVYNLYKDHCKMEEEVPLSNCKFYNELDNMNLALFKPRKDQCDLCSSYKVKQIPEEVYTKHIKAKNEARDEKDLDKKRALAQEIYCFAVDVQAVKLCPVLQASSLYYKTKLQIHNFTVYNLKSHRSMNYVWNETEGDLDASVFASCLIKALEEHLKIEMKPIVIFSDGCGYQNRNVVLANALSFLATKYNIEIEQKYLEKGHTQMECDSTHSLIERKLKNRQIYLPTDYISVIKEARKNPTPLEVSYIAHDFFINYEDDSKYRYSSIRPGKSKGDLKVTDIRALKYLINGDILFKVAHSDEYNLLPQRKNQIENNFSRDPLYSKRLPISKKKWNDLQELKKVLPFDTHFFYDNIPYKDSANTIKQDIIQNQESSAPKKSKAKQNVKKQNTKREKILKSKKK